LRDEVEFQPPLRFFGPLAAPIAIIPRIKKMFDYRHRVIKEWCENSKL